MAADLHGDTALHAAAASGHAECVELIVQMLRRPTESDNATGDASKPPHGTTSGDHQNDVNVRNSMGMTPCHLALNHDCLEVLYRYDANLCVEDDDHRSPLFVACAMNRQSCAEFIIGCLDQIDASLIAKDRRGDTPLHAAACNGSMECLLLLLQYGIDPRMLNNEGLKAIDLAEQNGHEECKQILSEYYLHYCTSSEFDSVLFLAALKVIPSPLAVTVYAEEKKLMFPFHATALGSRLRPARARCDSRVQNHSQSCRLA
jgi:ankyrin repeat protein